MVRTVGFNDQMAVKAYQIHDVLANGKLAPKLHSPESVTTQKVPKRPFCHRAHSPKGSGTVACTLSMILHDGPSFELTASCVKSSRRITKLQYNPSPTPVPTLFAPRSHITNPRTDPARTLFICCYVFESTYTTLGKA
jgi:hypothetical protein